MFVCDILLVFAVVSHKCGPAFMDGCDPIYPGKIKSTFNTMFKIYLFPPPN